MQIWRLQLHWEGGGHWSLATILACSYHNIVQHPVPADMGCESQKRNFFVLGFKRETDSALSIKLNFLNSASKYSTPCSTYSATYN